MQTQVFHIVTFGCQMNINDSGWLSRALTARGFTEGSLDSASIVIVNTCSVREKPELKVRSMLGRIRQETGNNPGVIVAVIGCVAQQLGAELFSYSSQVRLVSGPDGLSRIPDTIEDLQSSPAKKISLLDFTEHYEERPETGRGPASPTAFVNIMQGCDNFCTYCIVPYTRGRQKSRSSAAILDECRTLVDRGCLEITLLGQNVNSYGKGLEEQIDFSDLLNLLCTVPGDYHIRFMTSHPKDASFKLIDTIAAQPKICKHLHLPVQCGSDRLLVQMNRHYTIEHYLELIEYARKKVPGITFSSDIIIGFPGETEEDFQQTLSLIRKVGYMQLFTFIYSKRPGTPAAEIDDPTPREVILGRFNRLVHVVETTANEFNQHDLHRVVPALIEGTSKKNASILMGKSAKNQTVHAPIPAGYSIDQLVGKIVDVDVDVARTWYLSGTVTGDPR